MTEFDEILSRTLVWEGLGKLTDVPGDKGGKTKWGVTQKLATKYGYDVTALTRPQATDVYHREFYEALPMQGDYENFLPDIRIKWILFDIAVNSGPERAIKMLQQAVGAIPTGAMTPDTQQKVNQYTQDPGWADTMISLICDLRKQWYEYLDSKDHADDDQFIKGWEARAADNGQTVPSMGLSPLVEVV